MTVERGHGLTMSTIHDNSCCGEWKSGQVSTPTRAKEFDEEAARWRATCSRREPAAG